VTEPSAASTYEGFDESAVARIIDDLATRFSWEGWSGYDVVRVWDSRTAVLHHIVPLNGGTSRVLKVGTLWKKEKAREVYEDLAHLREVFTSNPAVELQVPEAFGWHDSPPCVCVEYVPGVDLTAALSETSGPATADLGRIVDACGAALGAFHKAYSFDPDAADAPLSRRKLERIARTMAGRVGVKPELVEGIDWSRLASRRYGDFAPYNLRVDRSGGIWVIDQPSGRSYAPVHRDVAYFLDRLDRVLARRGPSATDRWRTRAELETSLLSAYARTGPGMLDTPADKTLLSLYLTHKQIHTARKRLRRGRVRDVPRFLRMAAQWRRQATRSEFTGA
jgi:hypothetical protein